MQVSVENIGSLERKVHIEVPETRVASEVSNRLQSMTKTTKVQGFRPGKVPLKVIDNRYGEQVRKEVIGELVRKTLVEAIDQEKLKPAGQPLIEKIDDTAGKALAFTAIFEIYPEIILKPTEKLKFEKPICEISNQVWIATHHCVTLLLEKVPNPNAINKSVIPMIFSSRTRQVG